MNPIIHTLSVLTWGPAHSVFDSSDSQRSLALRDQLIDDVAPNPFGHGKDFFTEFLRWLLDIASGGLISDIRAEKVSGEYKFFAENVTRIRDGLKALVGDADISSINVELTNRARITFSRDGANLKIGPEGSPDDPENFNISPLAMLEMIDSLVERESHRFPVETVQICQREAAARAMPVVSASLRNLGLITDVDKSNLNRVIVAMDAYCSGQSIDCAFGCLSSINKAEKFVKYCFNSKSETLEISIDNTEDDEVSKLEILELENMTPLKLRRILMQLKGIRFV